MTPSVVLLILLNLFSLNRVVVSVPTCPHLRGDLVQESMKLLQQLGERYFPVSCLPYNRNISFPDSAFPQATANHRQCHQVSRLIHETLDGAERMFENYTCPDSWDDVKLDDLRNLQDQLLQPEQCLDDAGSSGLSSYFSNVEAVLQQENGSFCGWSALKRDVLRVLNTAVHKHCTCFTWRHARCGGHTH